MLVSASFPSCCHLPCFIPHCSGGSPHTFGAATGGSQKGCVCVAGGNHILGSQHFTSLLQLCTKRWGEKNHNSLLGSLWATKSVYADGAASIILPTSMTRWGTLKLLLFCCGHGCRGMHRNHRVCRWGKLSALLPLCFPSAHGISVLM